MQERATHRKERIVRIRVFAFGEDMNQEAYLNILKKFSIPASVRSPSCLQTIVIDNEQ